MGRSMCGVRARTDDHAPRKNVPAAQSAGETHEPGGRMKKAQCRPRPWCPPPVARPPRPHRRRERTPGASHCPRWPPPRRFEAGVLEVRACVHARLPVLGRDVERSPGGRDPRDLRERDGSRASGHELQRDPAAPEVDLGTLNRRLQTRQTLDQPHAEQRNASRPRLGGRPGRCRSRAPGSRTRWNAGASNSANASTAGTTAGAPRSPWRARKS